MESTTLNIVTELAAAAEKDGGWFDSSVVELVGAVAAVVVAYLGYKGAKATAGRGNAAHRGSGEESEANPPDLTRAAAERVKALETYGPARNERLDTSRLALERAIAALDEKNQADVRALALELLHCADPVKAAGLRDQLAQST